MVTGRCEFRRTTSMTRIPVDMTAVDRPELGTPVTSQNEVEGNKSVDKGETSSRHRTRRRSIDIGSYDSNRKSYTHNITAQFLIVCGLCQRRLPPGRDIFMYRGETAYCSVDCREEQMKKDEDEKREKSSSSSCTIYSSTTNSYAAKDNDHQFPNHHSTAASSDPSVKTGGSINIAAA